MSSFGAPDSVGIGVTNCRSADQVRRTVVEAESLGADIAFIAEDVNCRDAFQLAAIAALATDRIRLSTGVVNPFTRNPTSLAMSVASLDEISGGRAGLGLGSSSPALIEAQMGIDHSGSVEALREAVTIVRGLLRGETVSLVGTRFRYSDAQLEALPRQAEVPIVLAAMGPRMLHLAGSIADGVLLNVGASVEYVRWAVEHVRRGEIAAGREPHACTIYAWMSVYVDADRAAALGRAREWLATMLSVPRQGELLLEPAGFDPAFLADVRRLRSAYPHSGDARAAARHVPDEVAERLALIGEIDRIRTRLAEYLEAGVQVPVLPIGALRALLEG